MLTLGDRLTTKAHVSPGVPSRRVAATFSWMAARMRSSTSGIALLWVGWVIVVFHAALWALSYDEIQAARQWQTTLMLMSLGHSAILTGLGLAIIDGMARRPDRKLSHRAAMSDAGSRIGRPDRPDTPGVSPSSTPVTGAEPGPIIFPDGSVLVQTRLGQRRFRDLTDATLFVGVPSPRAVGVGDLRH